jgi:hypothetical protein
MRHEKEKEHPHDITFRYSDAPKEETYSCNVKETHVLSVDGKRQQDRKKPSRQSKRCRCSEIPLK